MGLSSGRCLLSTILATLAIAGCRRPLPAETATVAIDAGNSDGLTTSDVGSFDATPAPDVPATCPAAAATVDVCGCGCCGDPLAHACYYPELGESVATIANPMPSPAACANAGCVAGVRYVCCASAGAPPASSASYCYTIDRSQDGGYHVIKREGNVCTTLDLTGFQGLNFPISSGDLTASGGSRGPCDDGAAAAPAIGGLGEAVAATAHLGSALDIHAVLFFDSGAGIQAERLDIDRLDRYCGSSDQP